MSHIGALGSFNPQAPKYRTCCCHSKEFTLGWAIIETVFLVIAIIVVVFALVTTKERTERAADKQSQDMGGVFKQFAESIMIIILTCFAIYGFVLAILFVGIKSYKWGCVVPYLLVKILIISVGAASLVYTGVRAPKLLLRPNVSISIGAICWQIFIFLVGLKTLRFFRDRSRAIEEGTYYGPSEGIQPVIACNHQTIPMVMVGYHNAPPPPPVYQQFKPSVDGPPPYESGDFDS